MSRTDSHGPPEPIATFRRTRWVAAQWVVVSAIGFFGFAYGFGRVLAWIRGTSLEPIVISAVSPLDALVWIAVSIVLVGTVVIPHELLHGVFMARYGGEPSYGVGVHVVLPYAYAETRGASYTRNQLLVVLLAPFLGITALGLAAMLLIPSPLLLVPLSANAAGSIGDLWMAGVLLQYPADVRVGELPAGDIQGFGIYGSSAEEIDRVPGARLLSSLVTGAVGTLAVLSTLLVAAVFCSLAVGSGTVVIGDPDGGWFLLRHDLRAPGEVHLEIGAASILRLATLGGVVWTAVSDRYRALRTNA